MRVLFFYQHFWPDSPPYATMLRMMGGYLVDQGLQVSVMSHQPSYKAADRLRVNARRENLDGVQVYRLAHLPFTRRSALVRKLARAMFPMRACLALIVQRLMGRPHDVIVAATIPPVANGLFGLLTARLTGARFIYHFQDIYPEIGAAGGLWSRNSWKHRLLLALDSFTTRHADRVVVLSSDMRETLLARGIQSSKILEINNVMLMDFPTKAPARTETLSVTVRGSTGSVTSDSNLPEHRLTGEGRYQLVFAGNLGRFQALDALVAAFLQPGTLQNDFDLHFLGEGVMLESLKQQADHCPRIHFHGHQPFATASRLIAGCDAGIVSTAENMFRYAYPSKTLTCLGLGVPVLAIVEPSSALARTLTHHELGVVAGARSTDAIQEGLGALKAYLDAGKGDPTRIRTVFRKDFGTRSVLAQWEQALEQLARGDRRVAES